MTATIFVSSTPFDLALHRKKITESCGAPGTARPDVAVVATLPETSIENRLHLVRSAKAFIGIFGMVFGDIDPVSKKSLVQLELEEALAHHIPMLIYIMDEDEHWVLPKHVDTGASAHQLSELKGLLSQVQDVRFFDSADNLVAKVHNDLFRVLGPVGAIPVSKPEPKVEVKADIKQAVRPEVKPVEKSVEKQASSEPKKVDVASSVAPMASPTKAPGKAIVTPATAISAPEVAIPKAKEPVAAEPVSAAPPATSAAPVSSHASSLASKRYALTQPRFEFFKDKVKHLFGPYMSDAVLKDVLEYVLAGNTMSASSTLSRGTSLSLEDAIEEIRKTELIILDTVQRHAAQNNDVK